ARRARRIVPPLSGGRQRRNDDQRRNRGARRKKPGSAGSASSALSVDFHAHTIPQNSSFTANCICRGIALPVLVMLPNPAVPNAEFGAAKLGVLKTLKISHRSCRRAEPVRPTFLNSDRSMRRCGGPCSVLLAVLPAVLIGCAANAATLNHCAI